MTRGNSCTCAPCEITVCPRCGHSRYQTGLLWTSTKPERDGWYAHRWRFPGMDWSMTEIVYVHTPLGGRYEGRMEQQWSDRAYVLPHEEEK